MQYEVMVRTFSRRPTLVIRATLRADELPTFFGGAYGELYAHAMRKGAAPDGPPFARYPGIMSAVMTPDIVVEAGVTVPRAIEGEGRVEAGELPGGECAVTEHVGPYDRMEPAYLAVEEWMRREGREAASGPWEVYYSDPAQEPDPEKWRTEIVWPLK